MASERVRHLKVKGAVFIALSTAVENAGLPCHVLPDGITIKVDEYTAYEPDASVYCGAELDDDALLLPNPLIVVEVLSPSTTRVDTGVKLAGYFKVESLQHYLIIDPVANRLVMHSRADNGVITTRVVETGRVVLEPPGIAFDLAEIWPLAG